MSDGFNISRGNPGSSISEDQAIKRIGIQSPFTLIPQLVVEITDCAEEGGIGGVDPCSQLTLEIYSVMGQEDQFRQENGIRVDNAGQARIVLSTTAKADVDVHYEGNPPDENNPTLPEIITNASEGKKYHEIFFPVNPASLYAFKVDVESTECPDINAESGIYYFETGEKINIQVCNELLASFGPVRIVDRDFLIATTSSVQCNFSQGSELTQCSLDTDPTFTLNIVDHSSTQSLDNTSHITQLAQVA